MAHLWAKLDAGGWGILPLAAERLVLTGDAGKPVGGVNWVGQARGTLHLAGAAWVLLCRPGYLSVNGEPVALGIRALSDRDEIVVPNGGRIFFSTEQLARIVPFPGAAGPTFCARTFKEITVGSPCVFCPNCNLVYLQCPEFPGWTYGPCACGQDTSLDAGYRFCPEDL